MKNKLTIHYDLVNKKSYEKMGSLLKTEAAALQEARDTISECTS